MIYKMARHRNEYREEVGTKACIVGKILPKRSQTKKHEGCRKRGRPQLRWEDCVKRDLRKA